MESLKPQAEGCGAGCGCQCGGAPGKARWGICALILIIAGVLVLRAMNKPDTAATQPPSDTFATPVLAPVDGSNKKPVVVPESSSVAGVGTTIGAFSELQTVAAGMDAVFIYMPGKEATVNTAAPVKALEAAVRTLDAKGTKCGIFTLKAGSADYDQIGSQMPRPGVLAMAKGKGMNVVSGEITETKLVQGYVAASSAGGCGSGGCGPASGGCK